MIDTIADSLPLNVLEEKQKFIADPTYNPQFIYKRSFNPEELNRWGQPRRDVYDYCLRRLKSLPPLEKPAQLLAVTQEEITAGIQNFNQSYKLEKPIEIVFSENLITRCKVTESKIFFQLPIYYTKDQFSDLLRHELETHILRRLNNNKQPWGAKEFPDEVIRRTEEGLASLHTYIFRPDKHIRKSFYSYIATYLAQTQSFSEVFAKLREFGIQKNTAWNITTKVKRGLTDTSLPGGVTKNVCYLEGIIEVWQWLMDRSHDPKQLYWGRIGISQLEALAGQVRIEGLQYPRFLEDTDEYYKQLVAIGVANELDTLSV